MTLLIVILVAWCWIHIRLGDLNARDERKEVPKKKGKRLLLVKMPCLDYQDQLGHNVTAAKTESIATAVVFQRLSALYNPSPPCFNHRRIFPLSQAMNRICRAKNAATNDEENDAIGDAGQGKGGLEVQVAEAVTVVIVVGVIHWLMAWKRESEFFLGPMTQALLSLLLLLLT